jgi:ribose transport system substrate-binding protein
MKMRLYSLLESAILFSLLILMCCQQTTSHSYDYNFVILPRTLEKDFHLSLTQGAMAEANKRGAVLTVYAPKNEDDYFYQEGKLNEITTAGNFSGVLLTPNHSKALFPVLEKLDTQKIPFIIVDTPMDFAERKATFQSYCGFVGTDNQLGGALAADFIAREIVKGNIILVRGIETHQTSRDREIGFLKEIEKYPNLHILKVLNGQWDGEAALRALRNLPKEQVKRTHAIFAYNDLMALGIAKYFKSFKKRPIIVGYDGLLEAQRAILNGEMDATVVQTPYDMGKVAVTQLINCIDDNSFPGNTLLTNVTLIKATKTLTSISEYGRAK